MPDSAAAIFARLSEQDAPAVTPRVIDTAVVLGGSVAGLLAARVLSDHAATVIIIERDDPGAGAEPRPGVPHGSQIHLLLPGGRVQLERWFPGITKQAQAAGAPELLASRRCSFSGDTRVPAGSRHTMLGITRPLLESLIRERTLALPNVKQVTGRVTGLEFSPDAVTGVRHESDGETALQQADFVVDATGRSSRLGHWLDDAGWQAPPAERMKIGLNYASALLRPSGGDPGLQQSYWHLPGGPAEAAFAEVEGGRWMIVSMGYGDNRPGRAEEDVVRAWAAYPAEFREVVQGAEFLGPVHAFHKAENVRRDFTALTRVPARLVAVGDAVASFNPAYGQGMTSAALHASALSEYLRSGQDLASPAREFFRLQKVVVDAAWDTSALPDLALPHVDGPYPRGYWLIKRISQQLMAAVERDSGLMGRLEEVGFMLRHPTSLSTPGVLARILMVNLRASFRR